MLYAQTWKPKIDFYSLTADRDSGRTPLGVFACLHGIGFLPVLVVLQGPDPGFLFVYGFCVCVSVVIALGSAIGASIIFDGYFARDRFYSRDYTYSYELCGEILEVMGMEDGKITSGIFVSRVEMNNRAV
jgi:hypothetical protein